MSLSLRNLQPSGVKIEMIEKGPKGIGSMFIREMKRIIQLVFLGVNRSLPGGIKKGRGRRQFK